MKKIFFCLLLGAVLGAWGWRYYERTRNPTMAQRTEDIADRTSDKAANVKDAVVGESRAIGEKIDDARIVAVIKGKYVMDKDLSAFAISVACSDGNVQLTGSAASPELIVRAAELARETKGVHDVTSTLRVKD